MATYDGAEVPGDLLDFDYMGRIQRDVPFIEMAVMESMGADEADDEMETALQSQLDTNALNRLMYAVQREHDDLRRVVLHDVDSTWHLSAAFVEEWRGQQRDHNGLRSVFVFTNEEMVVYLIDGRFPLARGPIMFHVEIPESIMGLPKPKVAAGGERELWTWNNDFDPYFFERLEDALEEWEMLDTPREFGRFQLSSKAKTSFDRFVVQGF